MKRLREEVITVTRSIVDQVLDLPLNTVVIAYSRADGVDVMIRTGTEGWLTTGRLTPWGTSMTGKYIHEAEVRAWVREHESESHKFFMIEPTDLHDTASVQ